MPEVAGEALAEMERAQASLVQGTWYRSRQPGSYLATAVTREPIGQSGDESFNNIDQVVDSGQRNYNPSHHDIGGQLVYNPSSLFNIPDDDLFGQSHCDFDLEGLDLALQGNLDLAY